MRLFFGSILLVFVSTLNTCIGALIFPSALFLILVVMRLSFDSIFNTCGSLVVLWFPSKYKFYLIVYVQD